MKNKSDHLNVNIYLSLILYHTDRRIDSPKTDTHTFMYIGKLKARANVIYLFKKKND